MRSTLDRRSSESGSRRKQGTTTSRPDAAGPNSNTLWKPTCRLAEAAAQELEYTLVALRTELEGVVTRLRADQSTATAILHQAFRKVEAAAQAQNPPGAWPSQPAGGIRSAPRADPRYAQRLSQATLARYP
jgi:hypothetical protein